VSRFVFTWQRKPERERERTNSIATNWFLSILSGVGGGGRDR